MQYTIDFYKDRGLSPDERNAQRKNQRGVWLFTGFSCEARNPHEAIALARSAQSAPLGVNENFKLRARRHAR